MKRIARSVISLILVLIISTSTLTASAVDLISIFKGISSVVSFGTSAYSFMQIVGIIPPSAQTQMLVKITDQLSQVSEQLDGISEDLSEISDRLAGMEATQYIKDRYNTAEKYYNNWVDYKESSMDVLDNASERYCSTTLDKIEQWFYNVDYRGVSIAADSLYAMSYESQGLMNDILIAAFDEQDDGLVSVYVKKNEYEDEIARAKGETPRGDFTCDKLVVFDDSVFPATMGWTVSTYRQYYIDYVKNYLLTADADEIAEKTIFVKGFDLAHLSEAEAKLIAETTLDNLISRLSAVAVYQNSELANTVYRTYMKMVNDMFVANSGDIMHPKTGADAFINAEYMSHLFEAELYYDTGDEKVRSLDVFCDYLMLSLEKYAFFCQDILAKTNKITPEQEQAFYDETRKTVSRIEAVKKACYTGYDNYCYLTGTRIFMGGFELQMEQFCLSIYDFEFIEDEGITHDLNSIGYPDNFKTENGSSLIGNDTALVMTKIIKGGLPKNTTLNLYNYFKSLGAVTKNSADGNEYEDRGWVIVEKGNQTTMSTSDPVQVKAHKAFGDFYKDGSIYTFKDLPEDATTPYLVNRYTVHGSYMTQDGSLTTDTALIASAIYGEHHTYWSTDECTLLVGPANAPTFKSSYSHWEIYRDVLHMPYTGRASSVSAKYNMLYQNELTQSEQLRLYSLNFLQRLNYKVSVMGNLQKSDDDKYHITGIDDWVAFYMAVNDGYSFEGETVSLDVNNLNISTADDTYTVGIWSNDVSVAKPFSGTFEGNGNTIEINFSDSEAGNIGVFSYTVGATIRNLKVKGSISGSWSVGGIVGCAVYHTTIENCTNNATINNNAPNTGGIAGYSTETSFINCTNNGKINGSQEQVGGIAGHGEKDIISGCVNNGEVFTGYQKCGGIIGELNEGTVSKCTNNASVSGIYYYAGGIAGITDGKCVLENCVNCGTAGAVSNVGNVVGSAGESTTFFNCFAKKTSGAVFIDCDTTITISENTEIIADPSESAIRIGDGCKVIIKIERGVTLTLKGGNANGSTGAGAGIEVPKSASLTICGTGTLNAAGGNAAVGGNGAKGADGRIVPKDSNHNDTDWCYSGKGGDGGNGGGGAGAGIGGRGGNGGIGGKGANGVNVEAASSDVAWKSGLSGNIGGNGTEGSNCGNVTICGSLTANITGGTASTKSSSGGACGDKMSHEWYFTYIGFGGGGGGAGGNGYPAANIGSGGAGGGAGGGGGSGFINYWYSESDVNKTNGTGRGGAGGKGYANGETGKDNGPEANNEDFVRIHTGSGGSAGEAGGEAGAVASYTLLQSVSIPKARSFTYDSKEKVGVSSDDLYTISGNIAKNAGNYTATAVLNDGYCWSDGTLGAKSIQWRIAPAPVTVTVKDAQKACGEKDPTWSADVNGVFGDDRIIYTVFREQGEEPGTYKITPSGEAVQGNYAVTYIDGTLTITQGLSPDENGNYHITNANDWEIFDNMVKGGETFKNKTVLLDNDITITNLVGGFNSNSDDSRPFSGTFNGQGHKITLSFGWTNGSDKGAFSHTSNGAVIKNLTVDGVITGDYSIGGIVGNASATTFENCTSRVAVTGAVSHDANHQYAGGIAGYACDGSKFINCVSYGDVKGNKCVGGIAGLSDSGTTYNNCISYGDVTGKECVGGVIGSVSANKSGSYVSTLFNCIGCGNVTAEKYAGGIVGCESGAASIKNAHFFGSTSAESNAGGITGCSHTGSVYELCFYNKDTCPEDTYGTGYSYDEIAQQANDYIINNKKFAEDWLVITFDSEEKPIFAEYSQSRIFAKNSTVINNGLIYGLEPRLESLESYIEVSDGFTLEYDSPVGTGTVVKAIKDSEVYESYTVVIFGDVNSDGVYDGMDAVIVNCLANGMLTREQVGEAVYMAADCNHDGDINELDVDLLEQAGLLLAEVDQSKSEEELKTDSAYVEYLNLIEQNPANEEAQHETEPEPTPSALDKLIGFFADIYAFLNNLINFIKTIFA